MRISPILIRSLKKSSSCTSFFLVHKTFLCYCLFATELKLLIKACKMSPGSLYAAWILLFWGVWGFPPYKWSFSVTKLRGVFFRLLTFVKLVEGGMFSLPPFRFVLLTFNKIFLRWFVLNFECVNRTLQEFFFFRWHGTCNYLT